MKSPIFSNSERTKIIKNFSSLFGRIPCTWWNFCVSYNIFFMKLLRGFIFISYQDMLKNLEDNRKSGSPDDISPDQEGPVQQGFPRGQVYYASSAKQVRIFQTSAKIPAKQSWCRMFLARTFFFIEFVILLTNDVPNTVYFDTARFCFIEYDEGNILHIWFDDFEMQLSSIHVYSHLSI